MFANVGAVAGLAAAFVVAAATLRPSSSLPVELSATTIGGFNVTLSVSNEYERRIGIQIGDGVYPWEHLVEMHKETLLVLGGLPQSARMSLVWWVSGGTADDLSGVSGFKLNVTFNSLGHHSVQVLHRSSSSGAALTELASFDVVSKYVRRELRELTEFDRSEYFDAMVALYSVSQSEGEALYGPDFMSGEWLVREHLYGAAQHDCDHWHDDAGFLTHHVGITLQFEKSLQMINPRACSHYWDYTVDAKLAAANSSLGYQASQIFDEEWFGSSNPLDKHHVVNAGRFAYLGVKQQAMAFSNITNPHGLLRSPWNTNAVPYLMRYGRVLGIAASSYTLPGCGLFAAEMKESMNLAEIIAALNGELHGPVHIMVGGHWGYDSTIVDKITDGNRKLNINVQSFLLGSKFLWRQGYVRCPEKCDATASATHECSCFCPTELTGVGAASNGGYRTAEQFLNATGIPTIWKGVGHDLTKIAGLDWDEVLGALCHVGHPGEMFTSAAPQDPLFWPLHGLSERFVQLLRFQAEAGTIELDETWDYNHNHAVLSDTRLVCDWSGVEQSSMKLPNCTQGESCSGHRAGDRLPFRYVLGNESGQEWYTNQEFYDEIGPWSELLPYVYDKVTSWPGCEGGKISITTADDGDDDFFIR